MLALERTAAGVITYFNADYEPADKSEALFARLRRPDGLVEIIALRPEAIEVDRADFHLQGQHDQQSHAGDDGSDAKPEKVAQRERIIELGKELGCDKLSFRRLPIDRRLDAPVIAQVKGDTLEVEFNEDYVTGPYSSSLTPERLREVLAHEGAHVQLSTALRAPGSKAAEFIEAQRKTEQILPGGTSYEQSRLESEGRKISHYADGFWKEYYWANTNKSNYDPYKGPRDAVAISRRAWDRAVQESFAELTAQGAWDKYPTYKALRELVRK